MLKGRALKRENGRMRCGDQADVHASSEEVVARFGAIPSENSVRKSRGRPAKRAVCEETSSAMCFRDGLDDDCIRPGEISVGESPFTGESPRVSSSSPDHTCISSFLEDHIALTLASRAIRHGTIVFHGGDRGVTVCDDRADMLQRLNADDKKLLIELLIDCL